MLDGGWLNTGDTYYQDEKGYYVYAGRNDDMLKVGGIWTSPIEIEGRLIEHPSVLEAAIVGRADADGLVKPEAWIVLKDKAAAAGRVHARDRTARALQERPRPYKYPRWFNFVAELPKTATGKNPAFQAACRLTRHSISAHVCGRPAPSRARAPAGVESRAAAAAARCSRPER